MGLEKSALSTTPEAAADSPAPESPARAHRFSLRRPHLRGLGKVSFSVSVFIFNF